MRWHEVSACTFRTLSRTHRGKSARHSRDSIGAHSVTFCEKTFCPKQASANTIAKRYFIFMDMLISQAKDIVHRTYECHLSLMTRYHYLKSSVSGGSALPRLHKHTRTRCFEAPTTRSMSALSSSSDTLLVRFLC